LENTIGIIGMLGWQRRTEIVGFRSCLNFISRVYKRLKDSETLLAAMI